METDSGEKGCGTCAMFLYEDTYGNGRCAPYQFEVLCDMCCDGWVDDAKELIGKQGK